MRKHLRLPYADYEDTESPVAIDFLRPDGSKRAELERVECHHDSANFKQVWFALAALAILQLPVLATVGTK